MMRDGLIRIIVTLNFDLLIETALREVGVEPTVVSTIDGARGMEPLHAQRNLVWHLHGDYTHPEMLNTPDELRSYDDVVNTRLVVLLGQVGAGSTSWMILKCTDLPGGVWSYQANHTRALRRSSCHTVMRP